MHPFRLAVQDRDISSIAGMLAPDVKLYSPIPYRPFEGKETVMGVLHGLSAVTEELEYTDELTNDDAVALISKVKIGGRDGEALQLLRPQLRRQDLLDHRHASPSIGRAGPGRRDEGPPFRYRGGLEAARY